MSTGLELKLGSDRVALRHLVAAAGDFGGLLGEVARSYAGSTAAVTWLVEVREGSVVLPVLGEPAQNISPAVVNELTTVIADGLRRLATEAERPEYFSDRALEQARALANLASDDLPIVINNGGGLPIAVTRDVATHVDAILGPHFTSYGSVEGWLEAIQLHGRPSFAVYDALTGERIECRFSNDVTLDDLRPAIGRRVVVRGEIRTRRSGVLVRIDAHELRVFTDDGELPTPEDVLGILA